MNDNLFQWSFQISGQLPDLVKLEDGVWLKKNEILLQSKGDNLFAYVVGNESNRDECERKILSYLHLTSLVSTNTVHVVGRSGKSLNSIDNLGPANTFSILGRMVIPENLIIEIEREAPLFLGEISRLSERFSSTVSDNKFLQVALDYFFDSRKMLFEYDSGLVSTVTCLESMLNENPNDIKYKLSLRAAFLLRAADVDPIVSFDIFRKAYDMRSKLVHGATKDIKNIRSSDVSSYVRCLLKIFLILLSSEERKNHKTNERKQNLMREIDQAMLVPENGANIIAEISRGLRHFNVSSKTLFECNETGHRTIPW